ncbi:MAG: hypothetical protein EAZ61_13380 [Oscillatoriales cyanobacterium]|nr:MAG: hypothetical protein EAZ61_13380 [Oscillatoriales cyanobacterium]
MNNETNNAEEMNRNNDRFFDWLLGATEPNSSVNPDRSIDPRSIPLPSANPEIADPAASPSATSDLPPVGDIPTVQTRFNALIERRLRIEIEKNLPLFPWETSILDYETETAQDETVQLSWLRRLQQIELPIRLPDHTLTSIFMRCQELARQPLQEGLQIVRAIEHLFPNSDRWLHELTGTFLHEATVRDGFSLKERIIDLTRNTSPHSPRSFDDASVPQQAFLSMLAAREILQELRFDLTPQTPRLERCWQLEEGDLSLMVEAVQCDAGMAIHVVCEVPAACTVRVFDDHDTAIASCDHASELHLNLQNITLNQLYTLEINSGQPHTVPLQFAIRVSQ